MYSTTPTFVHHYIDWSAKHVHCQVKVAQIVYGSANRCSWFCLPISYHQVTELAIVQMDKQTYHTSG